ncbi:MAG: hypothetical protein ACWA5W_09965, partial [Phycisphaerales bacterium]
TGESTDNFIDDLIAKVQSQLAGLGSSLGQTGVITRGTFNALAVQSLTGSDPTAERTAKASEQTAKNTKQIADAANTGGLTFA